MSFIDRPNPPRSSRTDPRDRDSNRSSPGGTSPEDGALTDSYPLDAEAVVERLQGLMSTELLCHLRYLQHAHHAEGLRAEPAVAEFRAHAAQELDHARALAGRIGQLGGEPSFRPGRIEPLAGVDWAPGRGLVAMLMADLSAERHAVDAYRKAIRSLDGQDSTTRRLLERILEDEERHADELASLLASERSPAEAR
jgi:bacterioferritin